MKIEITVPTSLNEITLEQYQKFLKIAEENPEGNFLNAKMIEIFCGIPLSDSYKLKMSSVSAIIDILNEMLSVTPNHVEKFTLNGVQYGFIPDLDEMSLGEYIDLDNNIISWAEMHKAMNVLYRPIKIKKGDKYSIEDYDVSNPEALKDMPLDAAIGAVFFFLNLGLELSKHTILYSNLEEMENIQEQLISTSDMDGTHHFILSLEEMLQGLKISLN
jgi:hypothetical protein